MRRTSREDFNHLYENNLHQIATCTTDGPLSDITPFWQQKFRTPGYGIVGHMDSGYYEDPVRYVWLPRSSLDFHELPEPDHSTPSASQVPWTPATPPPSANRGMDSYESDSASPQKNTPTSSFVSRTSPRKRLNLEPSPVSSPKKIHYASGISSTISSALQILSSEQLIGLLEKLAADDPSLNSKLNSIIPKPDLKLIEEKMKQYRLNIQRSLPTVSSRLASRTDAVAFNRVHAHLVDFQKYLEEIGNKLKRSEHWGILVEFVFKAWNNVRSTPLWDNTQHNLVRRKCFRFLSSLMSKTIENSHVFTQDELVEIKNQCHLLSPDCPHMDSCMRSLETLLGKD